MEDAFRKMVEGFELQKDAYENISPGLTTKAYDVDIAEILDREVINYLHVTSLTMNELKIRYEGPEIDSSSLLILHEVIKRAIYYRKGCIVKK